MSIAKRTMPQPRVAIREARMNLRQLSTFGSKLFDARLEMRDLIVWIAVVAVRMQSFVFDLRRARAPKRVYSSN